MGTKLRCDGLLADEMGITLLLVVEGLEVLLNFQSDDGGWLVSQVVYKLLRVHDRRRRKSLMAGETVCEAGDESARQTGRTKGCSSQGGRQSSEKKRGLQEERHEAVRRYL